MDESDLRSIAELKDLPVFNEGDPSAESMRNPEAAFEVAEAEDMVRLHELLHRSEYRAVGAIRLCRESRSTVCVYFVRRADL